MCIADLTGSISTDHGDFNSVELSQSVFQTSLAPYNWANTTFQNSNFQVDTTDYTNVSQIDVAFTNPTSIIDLTTVGLQIGMTMTSPGANPSTDYTITGFANHSFTGQANAAVQVSPNISIDEGQNLSFGTTITTCSIINVEENVQTKDMENACVDFLMFFIGSGSSSQNTGHHPQTHIFTDDGFDFAVTGDQKILVWQGGATNQNAFIPAEQLSIGTPLVSWANDIYQYVQITSMSQDINNSVSVNWTTTGTNSYQLENGIVLKGFVDNYCSCKPSASLDGGDIPCESTKSYCVSGSSFEIYLSGSDSGGWEGASGTAGSTAKRWSLVLKEGDVTIAPAPGEAALVDQQFLTASFTHLSQSSKVEICYTESRDLGQGVLAEDSCCFELVLNRKPAVDFASPICQTNYGTLIDLEEDVQFIHADTVTFSLASGSTGTFSDIIDGRAQSLILDPASHAKGKLTLCYTASSTNPFCTDNANEIATTTPVSTPDCCPAISGCVDIFFNPGVTAGKDAIHCWPTMSLTGTGPIYTFTDTVVSAPTWSWLSGATQDNNYNTTVHTPSGTPALFVDNNTHFGVISNATNSISTEIHMNPNRNTANNFGFFTMQVEVSNGPCSFTNTAVQYVAKTFANAGADRMDCIGFAEGGTQGNLPVTSPEGFIQLQATGSGFWSYVDPTAALTPPQSPVIEEPTNNESGFRIAICGGEAEIQWTHQSSSTVTMNGKEYNITCDAVDTVKIEKKKAKKPPKIVGHLAAPNTVAGTNYLLSSPNNLFTESFSQSYDPNSLYKGPWEIPGGSGGTRGLTSDSLHDMHIMMTNHTTQYRLHYTLNIDAVSDELSLHIPTNLSTYPIWIWGGQQFPNNNNDLRMYRWREALQQPGDQTIHNVRLNNSESGVFASGFLTASKTYIPFGLHNPSISTFTSSLLTFSGSSSASFAAPSGSIYHGRDGGESTYHLVHLTGSSGDCNCRPAGAQGRIFHHLQMQNFRFASHSSTAVYSGDGSGGYGTLLNKVALEHGLEPSLGIDVPVYKDILALTFMSESVIMGSTGSSVIYTGSIAGAPYNVPNVVLNGGALFLTCSIGGNTHHHQNATIGLKPANNTSASLFLKSSNPATAGLGGGPYVWLTNVAQRGQSYPLHFNATSGRVDPFNVEDQKYPWIYHKIKDAEAAGSLGSSTITHDALFHQFLRNPTSGLADYGFSLNFEWRAKQIAVYNSLGDQLVHGVDIPAAILTGSFADTFSSESFIEAPTFFPAQRSWFRSTLYANSYAGYNQTFMRGSLGINGFEGGSDGRHQPYYSPLISLHSNNYATVATQSVMFECTASVKDSDGRLIQQYIISQSVMFIDTSTNRQT